LATIKALKNRVISSNVAEEMVGKSGVIEGKRGYPRF
jgi:hypothetical protein